MGGHDPYFGYFPMNSLAWRMGCYARKGENEPKGAGERRLRVMAMGLEVLLVILIIIVFVGFVVGRWWAEANRARYDMRRTWKARKNYRK